MKVKKGFTKLTRGSLILLPLPLVFSFCTIGHAATFDETVPTPESITQLEQRAQTADPREQCFLYTELVHSMTELAGKEK